MFLNVTTDTTRPHKPRTHAISGLDSIPAVLPCELDTIAAITIEVTIVAMEDLNFIPIVSGIKPSKIEEIVMIIMLTGL